jgi:hypothetical protein
MGLRKYIGIGLLLATRGISLFAADPDKVQSIADYVQESPTSITALASDGNTYPGKAS